MRPWAEIYQTITDMTPWDASTNPHNIVYKDERYRCLVCGAVSLKRHIIDEISCTKVPETFTEVTKRDPGSIYTFVRNEPFLPRIGDTWLTSDGLYVYVETRNDMGWLDTDTGRLRPGQQHLPGTGYNLGVKKLQISKSYSDELLASKALVISVKDEARAQVSAGLVSECFKRNAIQVTPIEIEEITELSIRATRFVATCMVIDRPPRKGWASSVPASAGTHKGTDYLPRDGAGTAYLPKEATTGWIAGTHTGKDV